MSISIKRKQQKCRPLLSGSDGVYSSRKYTVSLTGHDQVKLRDIAYRPSPLSRLRSGFPTLARLFREGFHDLIRKSDGALVGIVRKAIVYAAPGADRFEKVMDIPRGSRPLNLCQFPDGSLYFGEYFSNGPRFQTDPTLANDGGQFQRDVVHIYGSPNGYEWQSVYQFPKNTVRHVHGVFYDTHRDCAWILTGDFGDESGIWVTYDKFKTVTAIARGNQAARAVTLFMLPDRLIVPMDSNLEANFINSVDPISGEMTPLADLPGPVISSAIAPDGSLLLSTMVDFTEVEQSEEVCVLTSKSGDEWRVVTRFQRKPDRFTHPQLLFARQDNDRHVFSYGINVKGYDGCLIEWAP